MQTEVQKLYQKLPDSHANNIQKEDSQFFLSNIEADVLEPRAQSTPFVSCKNGEAKDEPGSCRILLSMNFWRSSR